MTTEETEDEEIRQLVYRLRLYYQFGTPTKEKHLRFLAELCPENAASVRGSKLRRAVEIIQTELPFRLPLTAEPESPPPDEYASPYPFATRGEYRKALETAAPIHTGWTKDICPDCSMRLLAKTRATAVALEEITKIAKDAT